MTLYTRIEKPLIHLPKLVVREREIILEQIMNEFGWEARQEAMHEWYKRWKELYKPHEGEQLTAYEHAVLKFNANTYLQQLRDITRLFEFQELQNEVPEDKFIWVRKQYDNRISY